MTTQSAQLQFANTLLSVLTGYGHIEDQRLEKEAGMDHHLPNLLIFTLLTHCFPVHRRGRRPHKLS
jgi:hypothetical protein